MFEEFDICPICYVDDNFFKENILPLPNYHVFEGREFLFVFVLLSR